MQFPTLCKYEWEGLLRKVMKVGVLLIATEVIGEKMGRMLGYLKESAERFP